MNYYCQGFMIMFTAINGSTDSENDESDASIRVQGTHYTIYAI